MINASQRIPAPCCNAAILLTPNIITHSGSPPDDPTRLPRFNRAVSLNKADNPGLRSTYPLKIDRIMKSNVCKTSLRAHRLAELRESIPPRREPSGEIKRRSLEIPRGPTNIRPPPPPPPLLSSEPIGRIHRVQEIETRIISSNHWRQRANSSQ